MSVSRSVIGEQRQPAGVLSEPVLSEAVPVQPSDYASGRVFDALASYRSPGPVTALTSQYPGGIISW